MCPSELIYALLVITLSFSGIDRENAYGMRLLTSWKDKVFELTSIQLSFLPQRQ